MISYTFYMKINRALQMKEKQRNNLCNQMQTPIYAGSRLPGNSRWGPGYVNTSLTDLRIQMQNA